MVVMEPVDPVEDFLTTRGTIEPDATFRLYNVTRDQSESQTDPWATAIPIRGSHGVERKTSNRGTGDIVTTETTWWITSLTTNMDLAEPTINSKILACGKVWLILDVTPNPRNRRLFECQTQLSPGG